MGGPEHRAESLGDLEDERAAATLTRRRYAPFMGKPRQKHPLQDNPFAEGFLDWMDSPEGQSSIEVSTTLWELMENVQLDARGRKIVWPDAERLSIDQSVEHSHKLHPHFAREQIASFLTSWIEQYNTARRTTRRSNSTNSIGSPSHGSINTSGRPNPPQNGRELGTLESLNQYLFSHTRPCISSRKPPRPGGVQRGIKDPRQNVISTIL
jgi:hypothetical protein